MANSKGSDAHFLSGSQTVTTAGTAVALLTTGDFIWRAIVIVAKDNNSGKIFVGGSTVASTTNRGLAAGDSIELEPTAGKYIQLDDIFIDSAVNSEGVDFYAVK